VEQEHPPAVRSGAFRGESVLDDSVDVDAGRGEDRDRAVGLADEELDLGAAEDDPLHSSS
jgi:hypothetical protein